MKVLFNPINGTGLGHLTRSFCIATELRRIERDAFILFVTDCPNTELLNAEFPCLRLPLADAPINQINYPATYVVPALINERLIITTILQVRPDVTVYDYKMSPEILRCSREVGAKNVLVLRKKKKQLLAETFEQLGEFMLLFDRVIVPHLPEEFGDYPAHLRSLFQFVGPIVKEPRPGGEERLRLRYQVSEEDFLITATCGGGGYSVDSDRFIETIRGTFLAIADRLPAARLVLSVGPLCRHDFAWFKHPRVTVTEYEQDLMTLFRMSKVVVSQAGYNAINEILVAQVPAIIIPARRSGDDQFERAENLRRMGLALVADYDNADLMASWIVDLHGGAGPLAVVSERLTGVNLLPGNGQAARTIQELGGRRQVVCAGDTPPLEPGVGQVIVDGLSTPDLRSVLQSIPRKTGADGPTIEVLADASFYRRNRSALLSSGAHRLTVLLDEKPGCDQVPRPLNVPGRNFSLAIPLSEERLDGLRRLLGVVAKRGIRRVRLILPDVQFKAKHKELLHSILRIPRDEKLGFRVFLSDDAKAFDFGTDFSIFLEEQIQQPKLEAVNWRITQRCNSRCVFCNHWRKKNQSLGYTEDDIHKLLDQMIGLKVRSIVLNGGEPTLHPKLSEIIARAKSAGIEVTINTNGFRFADRCFAEEIMAAGPDRFLYSILSVDPAISDGLRCVPNSVSRSLEGLRNLRDLSREVCIETNTVITRETVRGVGRLVEAVAPYATAAGFSMVDTLKDVDNSTLRLDCREMAEYYFEAVPKLITECERHGLLLKISPFFSDLPFERMNQLGRDPELDREIIEKICRRGKRHLREVGAFARGEYGRFFYQRNCCFVPGRNLYLMSNGDAFPCVRSIGYDDKFIIGNVLESSLQDILSQSAAQGFMRAASSHEVCRTCKNEFRWNHMMNKTHQGRFVEE